jgi:hypothetical protein
MQASKQVSDPVFNHRVAAETRDFLAKVAGGRSEH